jgi:hypothetical protein
MNCFPIDTDAELYPTAADFSLHMGEFYTGLTRDDVGGLRYLLSTNNINFENLLPGVSGMGANANSTVDAAWRPGVDKITFVPQPVDPLSGNFLACTNPFTDSYFTNGVLTQQQVARVSARPDILFSVGDLGFHTSSPLVNRTGTTNWINNAGFNGNPNGAGPGVIQPGITITFDKAGRTVEHLSGEPDEDVFDLGSAWGSFAALDTPVIYPVAKTGSSQFTVRMWLVFDQSYRHFEWTPTSLVGAQYAFQTSTNLIDWTTSFVATNDGNVYTYVTYNPASQNRFYRLIPQ